MLSLKSSKAQFLLTSFSVLRSVLRLHLDFTAGLCLYLSPCAALCFSFQLSLKAHFKSCVWWICLVVLFPISADTKLCRGKKTKTKNKTAVVMSSPAGHTWLHSPLPPPPPPSVRLSPRLSDLSLRSMHLCPIPDAKAHGKDGYHCPEQLCVPNGEVSQCFLFTGIQALAPLCPLWVALRCRHPAHCSVYTTKGSHSLFINVKGR